MSQGEKYDGLIGFVLELMVTLGEVGVGLAVFIETFVPPVPSEVLLPGAGFLAYEGELNPWFAWSMATLGALLGAWVWYFIGMAFGRDRTRRLVARIPLMEEADFERAEAFFVRWGAAAVLFGRCLPLVRSFVSIPAGIEHMGLAKFTLYTAVGSGVWNGVWIGLGYAFGPAISPLLARWSGALSWLVVGVLCVLIAWFVVKRLASRRKNDSGSHS